MIIQVALWLLVLAMSLCLVRIALGPTPPDRTVAIDILGTMIVSFTCLYAVMSEQDFYINIGMAWALLSFIGTLALAKHLEGRQFHD